MALWLGGAVLALALVWIFAAEIWVRRCKRRRRTAEVLEAFKLYEKYGGWGVDRIDWNWPS
jgi:hypothetical protein